MADLSFSGVQMVALRLALGFAPDDRDVTADDVLVVLAAQDVTDQESQRWDGLGPPP